MRIAAHTHTPSTRCQACLLYQLDYKAAAAAAGTPYSSSGGWRTVLTSSVQHTVGGLAPGTKYSFRSRGGYAPPEVVAQALATGSPDATARPAGGGSSGGGSGADKQQTSIKWGDFSVESSYATSGACACVACASNSSSRACLWVCKVWAVLGWPHTDAHMCCCPHHMSLCLLDAQAAHRPLVRRQQQLQPRRTCPSTATAGAAQQQQQQQQPAQTMQAAAAAGVQRRRRSATTRGQQQRRQRQSRRQQERWTLCRRQLGGCVRACVRACVRGGVVAARAGAAGVQMLCTGAT
jgi:hypothetical protein